MVRQNIRDERIGVFDKRKLKNIAIGRIVDSLNPFGYIGGAETTIIPAKANHVILIRSIRAYGHTAGSGIGRIRIHIRNAASPAAPLGLIPFTFNSYSTGLAAPGGRYYDIKFDEDLVIPSGCWVTADVQGAAGEIVALPDIEARYMHAQEASALGIYHGLQNHWYAFGEMISTVSDTYVMAGRSGFYPQVRGIIANGQTAAAAATVTINHTDGTTNWPFMKFHLSNARNTFPLNIGVSGIEADLPIGHKLRFTCSSNASDDGRVAFFMWGVYTKKPDTFNQFGLPALRGTATAGAATTITDSGQAWGTNLYAGKTVTIVSGTGVGQSRTILSNTATALTISSGATDWTTNPDNTSVYEISATEGRKFWVCADRVNAHLTETGITLLDGRKERYAIVRAFIASGNPGASQAVTLPGTIEPGLIKLRSNAPSRYGAAVVWPAPGLAGSSSPIISDIVTSENDVDIHVGAGGLTRPVPLGAAGVLGAEFTNHWTGATVFICGELVDNNTFGTTAQLNVRYQANA